MRDTQVLPQGRRILQVHQPYERHEVKPRRLQLAAEANRPARQHLSLRGRDPMVIQDVRLLQQGISRVSQNLPSTPRIPGRAVVPARRFRQLRVRWPARRRLAVRQGSLARHHIVRDPALSVDLRSILQVRRHRLGSRGPGEEGIPEGHEAAGERMRLLRVRQQKEEGLQNTRPGDSRLAGCPGRGPQEEFRRQVDGDEQRALCDEVWRGSCGYGGP